jgi:hypothetical protein
MQTDIRLIPTLLAAAALATVGATAPAAAQTTSRDTISPTAPVAGGDTGSTAGATTAYRLTEVGGKALPVEVEKEWRCREDVTAGTLTLGTDGRWLLETTQRKVCGDRTTTELETDDGRYTTEGQTFRFFDDDGKENTKDWGIGKDIDLDDLRSGALGGDGTLTVRLADDETTVVFRR